MDRKSFPISRDAIAPILEWVRSRIGETLLSPIAQGQLMLAVEEAVVNVLTHAQTPESPKVHLEIRQIPEKQVEIEVRDRADPFNPLSAKVEIDGETPLEEREEGGLGIPLMHRCVDALLYRYEEGENILTLIKSVVSH